jgi:membrane-associated phospholipid phosphatase
MGKYTTYVIALLLSAAAILMLPYDSWLASPETVKAFPGDLGRMVHLSELFAHGFGVIVVAAAIFLLAPTFRYTIPRIAICAFWPGMVVHFIKFQVSRIRPIFYFDADSRAHFPSDLSTTWLGWMRDSQLNTNYIMQSFPSAHTATVWGLAIGMTWAFPRGRWLFYSIALLASLQRIFSWAHWPSDVLAGAAIAFCFGGAITQDWGLGRWLGIMEGRIKASCDTVTTAD